jgi:hypothetical protein
LDKFTPLPPWKAAGWLQRLWSLNPNAVLVAEPAAYDILHIWMPTVLYSSDVATNPHWLADYLVPGRELWVLLEDKGNSFERVVQLIDNGMTVVTSSRQYTANDLMPAVRRAQRCGP